MDQEIKINSNIIKTNTPRWVLVLFKIFGVLFFLSFLLLLREFLSLVISEWPIIPPIDLNLYHDAGFLIIPALLGFGFFRMKRWLLPVIGLSLIGVTILTVLRIEPDFYSLALIFLILFILSLFFGKYLSGSYLSRNSYLVYLIFILAIILIYISTHLPVY